MIIVLDDLPSDTEHIYDFVYHNFGELQSGEGWKALPSEHPLRDKANYQNIRQLQRLKGSGPIGLRWEITKKLSLNLWQAPTGGPCIGITGMNNTYIQKVGDDAPSLFVRTRAKNQRFITVLEPLKTPSLLSAIEQGARRKM